MASKTKNIALDLNLTLSCKAKSRKRPPKGCDGEINFLKVTRSSELQPQNSNTGPQERLVWFAGKEIKKQTKILKSRYCIGAFCCC